MKQLQYLGECRVTGNPLKGKCKAIKGTVQENKEKRTREKTGEETREENRERSEREP